MTRHRQAFNEGRQACLDDQPVNPYGDFTSKGRAWADGWRQEMSHWHFMADHPTPVLGLWPIVGGIVTLLAVIAVLLATGLR